MKVPVGYVRKSIEKESKILAESALEEKPKKPKETCKDGRDKDHPESDSMLCKFKADEHSYIHEHLETLYMLTRLFKPDTIMEIGTGRGDSTLAFAEGCAMNGKGHVISIDIEDCGIAKDIIIFDEELGSFVSFIKSDSLKLNIQSGIGILFIDGLHTYEQVKKELKKYERDVEDDGFIIFHDSYNPAHPGVQEAIQEFMLKNDTFLDYDMFEYYNNNGLTILRKHIPDG